MFLNVQMDSGVVDNAAGVEKESIEFRMTAATVFCQGGHYKTFYSHLGREFDTQKIFYVECYLNS